MPAIFTKSLPNLYNSFIELPSNCDIIEYISRQSRKLVKGKAHRRNRMTLAEKIASNVETFGEFQAAKLLKRKVSFLDYYVARFGKLPRLSHFNPA